MQRSLEFSSSHATGLALLLKNLTSRGAAMLAALQMHRPPMAQRYCRHLKNISPSGATVLALLLKIFTCRGAVALAALQMHTPPMARRR